MLSMKSTCEKCDHELHAMGKAYICSYECTFCEECAGGMNRICPNCDGELVMRPGRERTPAAVAGSLLSRKVMGLFDRSQARPPTE